METGNFCYGAAGMANVRPELRQSRSQPSHHELSGRRALVISIVLHLVLLGIFASVHRQGESHRHMPGVLHITLRRQVLPGTAVKPAASSALPVRATESARSPRAGKAPAAAVQPSSAPSVSNPAVPVPPHVSTNVAALNPADMIATVQASGPAAVAGTAQSLAASGTAGESAPATSKVAAAFTPASADAEYLDNPRPEYPALARQRQQEGLVTLRVEVDASGKPQQVSVISSSRYSLLDAAAVDAVSQWRFSPARRGSEAVADTVRVPVRFSLRG